MKDVMLEMPISSSTSMPSSHQAQQEDLNMNINKTPGSINSSRTPLLSTILSNIDSNQDTPKNSNQQPYTYFNDTILAIFRRAFIMRRTLWAKVILIVLGFLCILKIYPLFQVSSNLEHHGRESSRELHSFITKKSKPPDLPPTPSQLNYQPAVNKFLLYKSPSQHFIKNFTHTLTVSDFVSLKKSNVMQAKIREMTKFSWDNYARYAWGHDMLKPRSRQPEEWFNLGLTIVDSVDTLLMVGLIQEGSKALDWIENELNFDSPNENSNCFELTIRVLGGLLSAYHLTHREKIKLQAIELGNRLLNCYNTDIKVIPYSDINLLTRHSHPPPWNRHSSLSEVASLQLEFRYLSQISGDPKFEDTTFSTNQHIHNITLKRDQKLLPMYIDTKTGQFEDTLITLGARTDSYYEYLLKQYLQTGIKWLETDYLDAVDEIKARLIRRTNGAKNFTFVSELQVFQSVNGTEELKYLPKMDHLICFFPGTLALGYYHFSPEASELRLKHGLETQKNKLNTRYDNHIELAKELSRTCYHMYSDMGTGLAPEITSFNILDETDQEGSAPELYAQSTAAYNILRPEFVETLFYMYHITGHEFYRSQAEKVFQAFHKYSRVATGFSAVSDVRIEPPVGSDLNKMLYQRAPERMESFWISETLKYLYLIFCDDEKIISTLLNNYVFNTEAHIIPIIHN